MENQAYANAFQKLLDENVTSVNLVFGTLILVLDVKNVIVIQWVLMITIVTILTDNAVAKLALERNPAPLVLQDIGDFLLGMISYKKPLITIFGHKHKIKNFDIFHENFLNAFEFWFIFGKKF